MARVFSAIDIEDPKILDRLEELQERLDLGFKTVEREKMHLTFEFFEDLNGEEIEQLKSHLENIEFNSFETDIKGIGVFPNEDYIRVVWAGLESEKIYNLYEKVSDNGLKSENNYDFIPHITLMRVDEVTPGKKKKLQKILKEFEDEYIGSIEVKRLKIFESELGPEGSRYKVLHEENL